MHFRLQALGNRQPRAIYKAEELHEKLEDISRENASFENTRATTCSNPGEVPDIEDDLQRELVFYEQVLDTVFTEHGLFALLAS